MIAVFSIRHVVHFSLSDTQKAQGAFGAWQTSRSSVLSVCEEVMQQREPAFFQKLIGSAWAVEKRTGLAEGKRLVSAPIRAPC